MVSSELPSILARQFASQLIYIDSFFQRVSMNWCSILCVVLFAYASFTMSAKHVDEEAARRVGLTFLHTKTSSAHLRSARSLSLVYKSTESVFSSPEQMQASERTYFYVFNVDDKGFVIVSGDDCVYPILGYSDQRAIDTNRIPDNARKWLEEYKTQIRHVVSNGIQATAEITRQWRAYSSGAKTTEIDAMVMAVSPLVETRWGQETYYDALCPFDEAAGRRTYVGCVATAMAQIMKYWNYPEQGRGFSSYSHPKYGELSANFGATTYNWNQMPIEANDTNSAVATLMFHCGVSVRMNYTPDGSGAHVIMGDKGRTNSAEYGLRYFFGYNTSMRGLERDNYSTLQWISMMKSELDARRPILYAGYSTRSGHAFVCDGYDQSNYFHFNWGWDGRLDGYFTIDDLNPLGRSTGGYTIAQEAIIGIEPEGQAELPSIELYAPIVVTPKSITYGQEFSVSTTLVNKGSATFRGDYCAAVFDDDDNFIAYVEILKETSGLPPTDANRNNIVFSTDGLTEMPPGRYEIAILSRPVGGNWSVCENDDNTNTAEIVVSNPSTIELNSAIKIAGDTTITEGQPISVNVNVWNSGSVTFTGQYLLGLYDLQGNLLQPLDTLYESNGLPPNETYRSPFLDFTNSAVTVKPGEYLLAMRYNDGSGWTLTGSTRFPNPIRVTVAEVPIQPDQYEENDSLTTAYVLPLTFTNDSAARGTDGSTIHSYSDVDYYKIQLDSGYSYAFNARVHDAYSSDKGKTQACDVMWSYSLDGTTWSDAMDDTLASTISFTGSKVMYVHVAPYFGGVVGAYLLDMTVRRSRVTSVDQGISSDCVNLYPNPATTYLSVDLCELNTAVQSIELVDGIGKVVATLNVDSHQPIVLIPVEQYPGGMYILRINTLRGVLTKKVIIGAPPAGM